MLLKRHKYFRKDEIKVKLTDEQYTKRIKYLSCILQGKELPSESRDHALLGDYKGMREFHLGGDMLLIYTVIDDVLYLQRLGTHSQLFK
ncbi:type II toxin-antitoxin system YafQ family toxin [Poseidonibacter lekithochrous]|uniref:type II toxin-antitoxin system YafQ family toxin n=1 Tax=Poseidonibacter lekithochrous TaxID=1904463 RepID=UPI0008FCDA69|nr:type II toxin-antitoxin system YafQ family toxin [Poseidonibacter lekithochrous]QKJ22611.1 toxin-antitoxin system, toxin component, YafQ family [Poseidonibacter lekithochrous]